MSAALAAAPALLKEADPERYRATLVLPEAARQSISALYAFAAEIAMVRDRVRDPAAGEIRLQFWADLLTGQGHGEVRQNPLAAALLDAIAQHGLPTAALVRAIDARRFDLYHDPMPDLATFEGYAGETVSVFLQLAAMVLNGGRPVDLGDAAGHLGVAQALAGHLRAFGYNASRGRIFLPLAVFTAHGVSADDIRAGRQGEGLTAALTQIAEIAQSHAQQARTAIAQLPAPLRPAFAPVTLVSPHLKSLDFSAPYAAPTPPPAWQDIARLAFWVLRQR